MFFHHERDLQLGTDTIGGTDKNRPFHPFHIERKKAAKAANITHYTGSGSLLCNFSDRRDKAVGLVDVDT